MLFRVRDHRLCAVGPADLFGRPVLVVIVDIGPGGLTGSIVLLESAGHVDAVLAQFFVGKLPRLRRGDSCVEG